ncbi:15663_t:CDS:2, partial [Entrophospora sp. SA101]
MVIRQTPKEHLPQFDFHVGRSSCYKLLYYGVPVLSLPLAFDQYGNAERLEFLNVGLTLNKLSFNVPEVIEKLERLLNDKNIEKNEDDKYIDGLMREWITPDTRMGFFKGNYYDVY